MKLSKLVDDCIEALQQYGDLDVAVLANLDAQPGKLGCEPNIQAVIAKVKLNGEDARVFGIRVLEDEDRMEGSSLLC